MKIENVFSFLVILALLLVSSLFTACNVNGPGIFYTIYNEKKISESLVSDKPVYKVVSAGSSLYVRAGAAVYKNDGTAWNKIDPPSAGMRAVSLAQRIGTEIYAVYESEASGALSDTIYTLSGTTWSKVPAVSAIDGSLNLSLITVDHDNNIFFINQRIGSGKYAVYSFDGSTLNKLTSADVSQPVISAAVKGALNYFLAASNISGSSVLYTTDGSSTFTTVITTGFDTAKTIGGISEDALNGNLYLSTRDGYLYKSSDAAGVDWGTGSLNAAALTDSYGNTARLGDMAVVDYNGTDYLIIAADNGYFEMDLNGTSPVLPKVTAVNFETYELSQEAVFSLYTETDKIYIGSDNGLWLSEYSGGPALDKE